MKTKIKIIFWIYNKWITKKCIKWNEVKSQKKSFKKVINILRVGNLQKKKSIKSPLNVADNIASGAQVFNTLTNMIMRTTWC